MNKIFVMMAAIAALGFTSCSNDVEEIAESSKELKLNIAVTDLNMGEQTRAVKTGWADGDKLNIWFDETNYSNPDLVIKYDGSEWKKDASATVSGKEPAASGNMIVLYEGYNDWNAYNHTSAYMYPKTEASFVVPYPKAQPIAYTNNNAITYTYESNTLTANLDSWKSLTQVQVVVTGLDSANASNYALKAANLFKGAVYFNSTSLSTSSESQNYTIGVPNADGVAFCFVYPLAGITSWTFTLMEISTMTAKTYTVSGKTFETGTSKVAAIKIAASNFE